MSASVWNIPEHLRREEKSIQNQIRYARYRRKLAMRKLGYSKPFPIDAEGVAK